MEVKDPNESEYRELIVSPNQYQAAVGALIDGACLLRDPPNGPHYTINVGDTYGQTLDHFMGQMACFKQSRAKAPAPDPIPHIIPGYKFNNCIIVARSTCFYIGNGLIATAGHSVFDGTGNVKADVAAMKIVFGLTNGNCNNMTIPAAKVFSIRRVCFGQNEPFSPGNADRADWAILRLDVDPASTELPVPLALHKWASAASGEHVPGAWTVGHPWGIGLTLSSPPGGKGYVDSDGANSLEHNLKVAPANSGGPFFSQANEVVGIVASGPGDIFEGRGFFWVPGNKAIIPFIKPGQTYRATKTNICRSLTHINMSCFVGLQLPDNIQAAAHQKQLRVEIMFGDGLEANWQSVIIIDQASVPLDDIQVYVHYSTLALGNANFRPWLIRALRITYTYPTAPGNVPGRGAGVFQLPTIPSLVFGCMDSGDQAKPANWTILFSGQDCQYMESTPTVLECSIFLQPGWKTIVNNHIGPIDLATWDIVTRPRRK